MTDQVEIPELEVGDLREYVPAIRHGIQALKYREAELLDRFEVTAFREARAARREMEALVELAETEM